MGRFEAALAAHQRVLLYREKLAEEPGADAEMKADVGRSLMIVGDLLSRIGRFEEGGARYRDAERLLVELVRTAPGSARALLAACREGLAYWPNASGGVDEVLRLLKLRGPSRRRLRTRRARRSIHGVIWP